MGYWKWELVGWRRLTIAALMITATALLAGCATTPAPAGALASEKFTLLEDFPEGFGRGFPVRIDRGLGGLGGFARIF